jgi:hypothetical protein
LWASREKPAYKQALAAGKGCVEKTYYLLVMTHKTLDVSRAQTRYDANHLLTWIEERKSKDQERSIVELEQVSMEECILRNQALNFGLAQKPGMLLKYKMWHGI